MTTEKEEPKVPAGIRVFVYGTLKKGHANHDKLDRDDVEFVGRCHISGAFRLVDLGDFPGLVRLGGVGNHRIYGEVYRVSADVLTGLDILEGNGMFYTREKIWTPFSKNCWCYFLPNVAKEWGPAITDGCWKPKDDEKQFIESGFNYAQAA